MNGGALGLKIAIERERRRRHTMAGIAALPHTRGARSVARRNVVERRRYAADPWAYIADLVGIRLSPQQEEAIELLRTHDRVLFPSGNNLGKTNLLACWGLYRFDALAALPNEEMGLREQGARILLPGPDADTIFATIYSEMLSLARRSETRGHLMPGRRSENSVHWRCAPKWEMEPFSPPRRTRQDVAHSASGRHHRNQAALVEEGQGVEEPLWHATEGMCSSPDNQIASSFNPTEPVGPAYQRTLGGVYKVLHISAFGHPNVKTRADVIPDAVDFRKIDGRVRSQCVDRGPWPGTPADPNYQDFVYALPPSFDAPEHGAREDGYPGHPDGELRVYRPQSVFVGQVLGHYPQSSETSLFDPAALDRAVARWRAGPPDHTRPAPDRVGVDPALDGPDADDTAAAPAWGDAGAVLLRAYAEAQMRGEEEVRKVHARRARVGAIAILPKARGPETAQRLYQMYPDSPFVMDEGGPSSSPFDHLDRVLGRQVLGVSFASSAPKPLDGEVFSENVRAALYVRAAMLIARDLVDVPDDPLLREELLATHVEYSERTIDGVERKEAGTGRTLRTKERVQTVLIVDKKEIKKKIGRSPDRADAVVLSLWSDERRRRGRPMYTGTDYQSL
jgi:hypothetical protein